MSKATHTSGPWAIDSELPPNGRSVIARVGTDNGPNIPISGNTEGPHNPSENYPNAALIAAAPELYELAKSARSELAYCIAQTGIGDPIIEEQLGEIIAKAEGR